LSHSVAAAHSLLSRFVSAHTQLNFVFLDRGYHTEWNVMMLTLRLRIILRQLDAVSLDPVHRPNMLSVRTDDVHVLSDL
jgi:hypothetical protein